MHAIEEAAETRHQTAVVWNEGLLLVSVVGLIVAIFAIQWLWMLRPLQQLATHDQLTGLLNHRGFWERAQHVWDAGAHPTIIFLAADLDWFKQVNDTYGHPVGDIVLERVGEALRQSVRQHDLMGRVGGEEFAWMGVGITLSDAAALGHRWQVVISQLTADLGPHHVTVSIGIASGAQAETLSALSQLADEALYTAKREGRNRVVVADKVLP
jgi:diguanylate cyclase (GGDEF)-like protein